MRNYSQSVQIHLLIIALISMVLLLACYQGQHIPTLIATPTEEPEQTPTTAAYVLQDTPTPVPTHTPAPPEPITPVASIERLQAPQGGLPYYQLGITLRASERRIFVDQTVLLVNQSTDTWTEIIFQLMPAHNEGSVTLNEATVTKNNAEGIQSYRVQADLEGMMLHVPLPDSVPSADVVQITLSYSMNIPEVDSSTWMPEGNLGAGDHVIQAGDWHAALVPYHSGQGWMTWDYVPVGDPVVYGMANYDVSLTTGPEWIVAAPGFVHQDGNTRYYHLDRARSFAFFASKDYLMTEGSVQGVPVKLYFVKGYEKTAQDVMTAASQALWLYTEYYGPYPMPELVIVQNAYYGSMEYSALTSLSQRAFEEHDSKPESQLIGLTVHEIAHQWWYGAAGNDQVHAPWLDESFAKYSEYLFYERYYPNLTDWWWKAHTNGRVSSGPIDRSIYDYSDASLYIRQLYPRGARFLADLRADMGDVAFFDFLKALQRAGDGRSMTAETFFAILEPYQPPSLDRLKQQYFAYLP